MVLRHRGKEIPDQSSSATRVHTLKTVTAMKEFVEGNTLSFEGPARFQYQLDEDGKIKANDDGTITIRWISDAALVMARVRAGFFTNYAADLALPAWLYIVARSLHEPKSRPLLSRLLGKSPELIAGVLFLASVASEVSQLLWPSGFFAGRFDWLDIVAYAVGIGVCYAFDKVSRARGRVITNVT